MGGLVRVRFVRRAAGALGNYAPGEEAEIPAELARVWEAAGVTRTMTTEPADLPVVEKLEETAMIDLAPAEKKRGRGKKAEVRDGQ